MKKESWKDRLTPWGRLSIRTEVKRGLLHFGVGFAAWLVLHPFYYGNLFVWVALVGVGVFFSTAEVVRKVLRTNNAAWARKAVALANHFTRESEQNGDLTTTIWTILGCTLAWTFGPRWICALSGLLLGVVDPVSKFGIKYPMGPRFKNNKSRGGMLFGFGAGVIAAVWVGTYHLVTPLFPTELGFWHIAVVYAVGVVSAPPLEAWFDKCDNLTVPAGTAILMSLVDIILPF